MTPECAEPFHMPLHLIVTGQKLERFDDVEALHLRNAPQQISGVIEHDPRAASLSDQLRDQISHASVAMGERLTVVVIALVRMLQHVLKM